MRKFPILYHKSSKDFKDRHKKERVWEDVAKEVSFPSGKEAETAFRNLRNGYSRDKKGVRNATVSGTGTDSVTDAKRETSELFLYLEWLEPYIQPRSSTSNLVVINDDSDLTADSTDKDMTIYDRNSAEPDNKVMFKSQVSVIGQRMMLTVLSWNSFRQLETGSRKSQHNPKEMKKAFLVI